MVDVSPLINIMCQVFHINEPAFAQLTMPTLPSKVGPSF